MALAIPAYIVPQGLMTLFAGPLSDRIGRREVIYASLLLFIVITAATASADRVDVFIAWRIAAGVAAAGVVPICLTLIGDVIPFERRGRAVGWMFGSIAGGTATGAAVGALLEPVIGWHGLFLTVAALSAAVIVFAQVTGAFPRLDLPATPPSWRIVARGYKELLSRARARRTYGYLGTAPERERLDRVSEASRDLNRLLDKPGPECCSMQIAFAGSALPVVG